MGLGCDVRLSLRVVLATFLFMAVVSFRACRVRPAKKPLSVGAKGRLRRLSTATCFAALRPP